MKIKPTVFVLLAITVCGLLVLPITAGAHAARVLILQDDGDGVRRIKPDEVREQLKQKKAVLVDVRSEASYKAGHIKGALNIPYNQIADRVKELPADKMVITYCS
jgi:predicted sulfurtransferase